MQRFLKAKRVASSSSESDVNSAPRKVPKANPKEEVADQVKENDLITILRWQYALEGPGSGDDNQQWIDVPTSIEKNVIPRILDPAASRRVTLQAFSDDMQKACTIACKGGKKIDGKTVTWMITDLKFGKECELALYNRIRSMFLFLRRVEVKVPIVQLEANESSGSQGSAGDGVQKKPAWKKSKPFKRFADLING